MYDSSSLVEFRDLAGVYIQGWGFLYAKAQERRKDTLWLLEKMKDERSR